MDMKHQQYQMNLKAQRLESGAYSIGMDLELKAIKELKITGTEKFNNPLTEAYLIAIQLKMLKKLLI